MTDTISDMLTRIRNGLAVNKSEVVVPHSKMKYSIAKILEKEGYVGEVKQDTRRKHPVIRIGLRYEDGTPGIQKLERVSKPGRRIYSKADELPYVLSGLGIAIISTSNGLMTNKEARKRRLGGEVICKIA